MTLLSGDIKLLKSERMTDNTDGGGRMTSNEVIDNQLKNVFDSLSDLDSAYGNVSMRKVFAAVQTANTDTYYGANVIIADPPDDPIVDVVMFNSKSWTDTRSQAIEQLSSNLSATESIGKTLYEDVFVGGTSIKLNFTVGSPDLIAGKTYKIEARNNFSQEYFRIVAKTADAGGVQTYSLVSPLKHSHGVIPTGPSVDLVIGSASSSSVYYGVKPLSTLITTGATSLVVPETFVNILPPGSELLDESTLGINPAALPADGRVDIFNPNNLIVVHNTQTVAAATYSNGNVVNLGRVRVNSVTVRDSTGAIVPEATRYTPNYTAGTVTFSNVSGLSQPLTIEHRIEDMVLCNQVDTNGTLHVTRQISHDYPVLNTYVSTVLVINDMQAHVTAPYDQQTWTGVWSDTLIGNTTLANYNDVAYPIQVTNTGALQERWVVIFDTASAFRVIGETVGQIAQGDINTNCQPLNPATGAPYFVIQSNGWGTGWSAGNCLRFNTFAANYPIWLIRSVKQGIPTLTTDMFKLIIRGNAE